MAIADMLVVLVTYKHWYRKEEKDNILYMTLNQL